MEPIAKFKSAFISSKEFIHGNNAGVAPLSLPAVDIVKTWADRFAREGTHAIPDALVKMEDTRARVARVFGAKTSEVAFFMSAAVGISQVALGLALQPGDEIIVWDQEYPSNFHPWRLAAERSGAKVIIAKSGSDLSTPLERIADVVTPRTRVIAASWVQYRTGAITDLEALGKFARDRGIFTCIDIIQGAGIIPFDFGACGIDAAIGGSHKWLVSPLSVGFLLIKEDRILDLAPLSVGAMTYGDPDSLPTLGDEMKTTIERFEPGSKGKFELLGLGASLELIEEVSVARIGQEVEWLSRTLMHGLREIGYEINSPHGAHHRGSIVNFRSGGHAAAQTTAEIAERLTKARISFGVRPPGVRLSLHAFNTKDEIDQILKVLS